MRKVYIVPNLVTSMNLFCGFYSIVASIKGDLLTAAWAVLAASIFDMLDGKVARLTKTTSQFGIQYDSMSDLASFGVAPGILAYQWCLAPFDRLGWMASFLFVCCGALRLARFNVRTEVIKSNFFEGVPIPLAAGLMATFYIFQDFTGVPSVPSTMVLVFTFGLSSLMVSSIPFPSFKGINLRSRSSFGWLVVGVLTMILILIRPEVTLFLLALGYLLIGLAYNLYRWAKGAPIEIHTAVSSTATIDRTSKLK